MIICSNKKVIFVPERHKLLGCETFAQSPQLVIFENYLRIYFSTRCVDYNGKFLSKIAFIDIKKDFSEILNYAIEEVIPLGNLGTFDEHGIFPISPLKIGNEIWAYTCGWSRRISVSVETATGLAISKDGGLTFSKVGTGPIFSNSLKEPFLVGDSFVRKFEDKWHMWYIFGLKWKQFENETTPDRIYKIGHATSLDGLNWERTGNLIISNVLGDDECQALPSVAFFKGLYHMVFCYRYANGFRNNAHRGYQLGYASSKDCINWVRDDNNFVLKSSLGDWDFEMKCYPHLSVINNELFLLYNGNEFGKHGFGVVELKFNDNIIFKINNTNSDQLFIHLQACDNQFIPKLSSKINLEEYSKKICLNAMSFEAWENGLMVGNVSMYVNEVNLQRAFITNVTVLKNYSNIGIAQQLLNMAIKKAHFLGFKTLVLKVISSNSKAIQLYKRLNFRICSEDSSELTMELIF